MQCKWPNPLVRASEFLWSASKLLKHRTIDCNVNSVKELLVKRRYQLRVECTGIGHVVTGLYTHLHESHVNQARHWCTLTYTNHTWIRHVSGVQTYTNHTCSGHVTGVHKPTRITRESGTSLVYTHLHESHVNQARQWCTQTYTIHTWIRHVTCVHKPTRITRESGTSLVYTHLHESHVNQARHWCTQTYTNHTWLRHVTGVHKPTRITRESGTSLVYTNLHESHVNQACHWCTQTYTNHTWTRRIINVTCGTKRNARFLTPATYNGVYYWNVCPQIENKNTHYHPLRAITALIVWLLVILGIGFSVWQHHTTAILYAWGATQ
jgi:hypothetical protein